VTSRLRSLRLCVTDAQPTNAREPVSSARVDAADRRTVPAEDVRTGETFTTGDHGVPVVLHSFAVRCGSCRTQRNHLAEFHDVHDGEAAVRDR